MEVVLVIIGGVFLLLSSMACCIYTDKQSPVLGFCLYILFAAIGFVLNAWAVEHVREIPAIEVYRGNTTLQITYQDSIPVDSIVVYKKK